MRVNLRNFHTVHTHFGLYVPNKVREINESPSLSGAIGQRLFLSGITDDQFHEHRTQLRNVTIEDVKRVSEKYLGKSRENACTTALGPQASAANDSSFVVEELLPQ